MNDSAVRTGFEQCTVNKVESHKLNNEEIKN